MLFIVVGGATMVLGGLKGWYQRSQQGAGSAVRPKAGVDLDEALSG